MKRRTLDYEDNEKEVENDSHRKSKRIKEVGDVIDNDNIDTGTKNIPASKDRVGKSTIPNSISSFLNPNNLKNEWCTPPKQSTLTPGLRQMKDDQISIDSVNLDEELEKFSHVKNIKNRTYRKSQNWDEEERTNDEQPIKACSVRTSFDRNSVCVVDRRRCLKEVNQDSSLTEETSEEGQVSRKWYEMCPEPVVEDESLSTVSSSERFPTSANTSSSASEYFSSNNRRRSDSIISYNSAEKQSPLTKDFRLCKTPGSHRSGRYHSEEMSKWKVALQSRSKSYSHKFIDTHCHIDFLYNRSGQKPKPFEQFINEHSDSFPANYAGCVAVFCNPRVFSASPAQNILRMLANEKRVWIAVGCHPKNAADFRDYHVHCLRRILQEHPRTVALGEIGLDYSGTFYRHADVQKSVFQQQLDVALELKLPLVIHCRDAYDDCLEIMKKKVPQTYKIHLHCFTRQMSIARKWMDYFPNLFVGFTPLITYSSAKEAMDAATAIPLERLLLETDSPYFVPTGVPSAEVNSLSHPGFAIFTAEKVASLKNIPVDTVLKACRENTRTMYGI